MKNYEAIVNLTPEQLEKFLDQVFLTGFNSGYQSLVDPEIYDGNPFDSNWLNGVVEEHPALVEDELGESFIIEPLVKVVKRIAEFDTESIAGNVNWQLQIVLPKTMESGQEDDNIQNAGESDG